MLLFSHDNGGKDYKGGGGDKEVGKEGEAVGSPFASTRSRALYAMDNAPHKGATAYFMPASSILRIIKSQAIIKYSNVQKSRNNQTKNLGNKKMKRCWK
jgi:hypothetical protein